MTGIPATMQSFTIRLIKQRRVSPRAIAVYRDTMRLFVTSQDQHGPPVHQLDSAEVDAPTITVLETANAIGTTAPAPGTCGRPRSRSLLAYASLRHLEHAATIQQVHAILAERFDKPTIGFPPQIKSTPSSPRWTSPAGTDVATGRCC